jgi:hypothetical protein
MLHSLLQFSSKEMTSRQEMIEILEEKCLQDVDLVNTIIQEYVLNMNEDQLTELEDFLSNNFGDD